MQTFDEAGAPLTLEARNKVYALGMWHKSAQVYLFYESGELLIQQRSHLKDLWGGLWSDSVGEHLSPGESFEEGAIRGLHEELQVINVKLRRFGEPDRSDISSGAFVDREFKQAYFARFDGVVTPDPAEVKSVAWINLSDFLKKIGAWSPCFCPSFLVDVDRLDLIARWNSIVEYLRERN